MAYINTNFLPSSNPNEKFLCFICKKGKQFHLDYIPDDLLDEDQNNNLNNNSQDLISNDIIQEDRRSNNDNIGECEVCYEEINKEDLKLNSLPCGDLFCTHCWFNYLKTLITEAKVDEIKCMNHECNKIMTDEFIYKHISKEKNLIDKYNKFKKRSEIIKDKNKNLCPNPDCDSFLQKNSVSKYVQYENGHKYCFDCLNPPHGNKSCDKESESLFMDWKKDKRVKRCPRCQMFTEKNEGCNHMTCVSCQYQWCWLCEGKYTYGHYNEGKCKGYQFIKADNLEEIQNRIKLKKKNAPFGIHKIFPCVYEEIYEPYDLDDTLLTKYLYILGFWLLGFSVIAIYLSIHYFERELSDLSEDTEDFLVIINVATFIILSIPFQILFTCILTPFILISLVYHKFFDRLLMFFGIGEHR